MKSTILAAVVLLSLVASTMGLSTDHYRTETYSEQGGFLLMWFVGALVLVLYTVLFLVFKHSLLTRWHFLLGMDVIFMLGMYVCRFGVYLEATFGDYSANVFFDQLVLLFQFAVVSDLLLLWLYEYARFARLTLVDRSSFCADFVVRPSFPASVIIVFRGILSAGLLTIAVLYSSEETKNQDTIGLLYFVVHTAAFVVYCIFPLVLFNLMLSAYSYTKKARKSARRVLRDISFSYLYIPAFATLYFFVIVLWMVISRQNLGKERTISGVVHVEIDTHEAMKTPVFAVVVLLIFAFRMRDYQELRDLNMFSEYEDVDELATWSNVEDDDATIRKASRQTYNTYPVQDPETADSVTADEDDDEEYTYATDDGDDDTGSVTTDTDVTDVTDGSEESTTYGSGGSDS